MLTDSSTPTDVLNDFLVEINRLEEFDAENQTRFSSYSGNKEVVKKQLHLLTEYIFFVGFRSYEGFVRDIFLLYCFEHPHSSGQKVISFLRPTNHAHAENLIQSSMRVLDWNSPDKIIERAETYLENGFPFKLPYHTHLEQLRDFKFIRNHIAHNSKESLNDYRKVLRRHYGVIPLEIPSPGEFLLVSDKKKAKKYKLLVFFDLMKTLAKELS